MAAPLRAPDNADQATAALAALRALNRAVAVLGDDGRVLLSNPRFDALFGERLQALADADGAGPRDLVLDDGRTLRIETAPLPQGLLVTADDISEIVEAQMRAAEAARTDALTGLGNRAMLRERLTELLTNSDTTDTAAVLAIELGRFKMINDALGPAMGDALLRLVADRLRSALGRGAVAARLRADEFLVLQRGPLAAAEGLAQRLVDLLGRSYLIEGQLLEVGASVGIALIPADGADADAVLKNAGLALQRARQEGGYRFFETAMDAQMQARRSLELDLRRALALREFALVYQPQVNLASGRVKGFEALLRWHHPERGLVPPATFIPLAEEIGVIVPIGEWVLRAACCEATGWGEPLTVAVNVSAAQFGTPGIVPAVLSALAESGLDPRRLELEITESVLLGDRDAALEALHQVRALGVRVSMDDFGTGYSSLSYLRSFPFDKIKIDQSFVRVDPSDTNSVAIVRAIAALGRSLGMSTTAEGVETETQRQRIAAEGCTDIQGYLISRPMPPEQIESFLRAHAPGPAA
jgi:diguanylate cyclase (GGDEF)-like protein